MKFAIVSLAVAAVALAQGESPLPQVAESTAAPMESIPAPVESTAAPMEPTPLGMPSIPAISGETRSLLYRLMSYFDLTHLAPTLASTPVLMLSIYDPSLGKFVELSATAIQSGDAYYVPVCPTDAIVSAGEVPAMAQNATCNYGIQLTPMPGNAASALYKVLRTKIRLLLSIVKPGFWGTGYAKSLGMLAQPGMQMEAQTGMQMETQPGMQM
ncbi:hypothetical protein LPJ63_005235 [Coemansia sp. RSA 2711]|nr:hypothetical protein LPJ63_005235 [Coemansia sp. RSA 2711]